MKPTKVTLGDFSIAEKYNPIHSIDVIKNGVTVFNTDNSKSLVFLSEAISLFFKEIEKKFNNEQHVDNNTKEAGNGTDLSGVSEEKQEKE